MTTYKDAAWADYTDVADTWAIDELDRVMGNLTVRYPRKGMVGGEWDYLMGLPGHIKRSMRSTGDLSPHGEDPDVAAVHISNAVPGIDDDTDAAMEWYVKTCRAALQQRRDNKMGWRF